MSGITNFMRNRHQILSSLIQLNKMCTSKRWPLKRRTRQCIKFKTLADFRLSGLYYASKSVEDLQATHAIKMLSNGGLLAVACSLILTAAVPGCSSHMARSKFWAVEMHDGKACIGRVMKVQKIRIFSASDMMI
jgi:hypothetical protein